MKKKNFNLTTLILVILLVGVAFFAGMMWMRNKNLEQGKASKDNQATQNLPTVQPTPEPLEPTIGGFVLTKDEVCQENDKPSIYYFGYSGCPHCKWNYPIMQAVAKKFPTQIVFHDNMDKLDKLTDEDSKIMTKYQNIHGGSVPFLAFGCKYLRVGSGENPQESDGGKTAEDKNLTAIICKLTNNQPEKVCASVKDLVEQIK